MKTTRGISRCFSELLRWYFLIGAADNPKALKLPEKQRNSLEPPLIAPGKLYPWHARLEDSWGVGGSMWWNSIRFSSCTVILAISQKNNLCMNQREESQGKVQACCAGGVCACDTKQEFGCFSAWLSAYLGEKTSRMWCWDTGKRHLCNSRLETAALKNARKGLDEQEIRKKIKAWGRFASNCPQTSQRDQGERVCSVSATKGAYGSSIRNLGRQKLISFPKRL